MHENILHKETFSGIRIFRGEWKKYDKSKKPNYRLIRVKVIVKKKKLNKNIFIRCNTTRR